MSNGRFFSPGETPDLHDLVGKAFEEKYVEYEEKAKKGEMQQLNQFRQKIFGERC
jgi:ribonucleoside-diphosphate reductase alpha chain